MYLYFDKTGKLKEIINDEALRQGNFGVNKMYVYFEKDNVVSLDVSYLLPSGLVVGPQNYTATETTQIPFDAKRDLLYFKYYQDYTFFVIDLEQDINGNSPLDETGTVHCDIKANISGQVIPVLGEVNFYVEQTSTFNVKQVASQEYLSLADYQFLRGLITDTSNQTKIYVIDNISTADLSSFVSNQLFYDRATNLYYNKDKTLANGNGLLGNKGALIRLFGLEDTITLQEIYNILGANRYGVLNVDGKEYLVTMSANNSIVAFDLADLLFYEYIDAPSDTFADVTISLPTKFVRHVYSGSKIYGTDSIAQDTTLSYGINVINNGIVQRESTGQIRVPTTPTQSYHAASKSYVDSNYGKKVELDIDNDTFVLTVKLLNNFDTSISSASVDLPLESIVVSAQYYDTYTYQGTTYTQVLVIELATTSEPTIVPIGDLVSGLVSETTFNNAVAQLQTNINACVQKTSSTNVLYGTNGSGNQTNVAYSPNVVQNGIVQRDATGQINVSNTPSAGSNATSKTYVDTFGRTLDFTIDTTTYTMTFKLKDNSGNVISTQTIDLPLETMVVDGYYDSDNENLVLELKNGSTITIPISDLISGLVSETSLATTLSNYYTKAQIDQMVSGFVFADVDDFLSDSSQNPVENRVITDALKTKANTQDLLDGSLIPNKALTAQQIENVSEESGVVQETPFISQGTSTSNNTEETPTAPVAKQLEKQGNSVVVNQLVREINSTYWSTNNASATYNNGVGTFTATATSGWLASNISKTVQGHKYLTKVTIKTTTPVSSAIRNYSFGTEGSIYFAATTDWQTQYRIITGANNSVSNKIIIIDDRTSGWDAIQVKDAQCIDLTQWFNGDIPQDLLDHPEHWSWYDNTDNAYNTGSLDNSSGRYLICTGRNQWDEEWENGIYGLSTGNKADNPNYIRNKTPIRVIPNGTYYIKTLSSENVIFFYDANGGFIKYIAYAASSTFTIPANCGYINFYSLGTTYNHDITISVYYTTGDGYDQYYPYVAPKVYDTGTETLRSAGSVKDYKTPDGTITRRVGVVDLGSLNWTLSGSTFVSQEMSNIKIPVTANEVMNILCAKYYTSSIYDIGDKKVCISTGSKIWVQDGSYNDAATFKTAMSGVYLFYELATPTTEEGTPFAENIEVDDYGTMYWLDTNNELVSIPQGTKLFYPADYVLLMDDLNIYTNGDVSKLALKTDLTASESVRDTVDAQLKEALGGTLRQLLANASSIDFNNTAWIDLGDLSWLYDYSNKVFYAQLVGFKTTQASLLSTKFSSITQSITTATMYNTYGNNRIGQNNSNDYVYVTCDTYTNANEFKNAMKGVLLAYEKAS